LAKGEHVVIYRKLLSVTDYWHTKHSFLNSWVRHQYRLSVEMTSSVLRSQS